MRRRPDGVKLPGFTLIELLVVITIIGILAAIALPNYIKAKDKAKEVQTKSAVKSIQIAIERYSADFEQYPQYILGGDREGWRVWHDKFDEPNPSINGVSNAWTRDILLEYGYMEAYPENPFVDNGNSVIAQTGPVTPGPNGYQPGDGDPRFGFRGNTMGNGLDHPIIFRNWYGYDTLNFETERILKATTGGNPQAKGFATPDGSMGGRTAGLHYCFGGRRAVKVENGQNVVFTTFTHWPGNFFYRGISTHDYSRKGWTIYLPNSFVKTEVNRYIMGAYGSYTTEGTDVIRLEKLDTNGNAVYYQFPPPWAGSFGWPLGYNPLGGDGHGLPEISGGGNETQGPWYPPNRSVDFPNAFIYGAPDGRPDGVILVLTAGDEVQAYQ